MVLKLSKKVCNVNYFNLLFDLNPFFDLILYLFFYNFFFYLARQSKNKTKMTNLVDPVLSICQVNEENHSITDLGPGCAKLYYQF